MTQEMAEPVVFVHAWCFRKSNSRTFKAWNIDPKSKKKFKIRNLRKIRRNYIKP